MMMQTAVPLPRIPIPPPLPPTPRPRPARVMPLEPEPLFHSAEAALRFAFSQDDASLARSSIMSMVQKVVSTGRRVSLRGMDRAAQAGMILHYVHKLGPLYESVLKVASAQDSNRCSCRAPCCSGWRANPHWAAGIDILKWGCREALPKGSCSTQWIRAAILVKIYGRQKITFDQIATDNSVTDGKGRVDPEAVSRYYRAILRWLKGGKDKGGAQVDGIEQKAWAAIERSLWEAGIVGDTVH